MCDKHPDREEGYCTICIINAATFDSEELPEKPLQSVKNAAHEPCCEKRDVIEDDKGALSCGNCGEDIF